MAFLGLRYTGAHPGSNATLALHCDGTTGVRPTELREPHRTEGLQLSQLPSAALTAGRPTIASPTARVFVHPF